MSTIDDLERRSRFWYYYLNQDEVWFNRARERLLVAEMDGRYRHNVAAWLLRRAPMLEMYYSFGEIAILSTPLTDALGHLTNLMPGGDMAMDAFEREQDERSRKPTNWLRTTVLYKAMVAESVPYHQIQPDGVCRCGTNHSKPPSGQREGPGEMGWEVR